MTVLPSAKFMCVVLAWTTYGKFSQFRSLTNIYLWVLYREVCLNDESASRRKAHHWVMQSSHLFSVKRRLHLQSVSNVHAHHRNKNCLLLSKCSQLKCLAFTFLYSCRCQHCYGLTCCRTKEERRKKLLGVNLMHHWFATLHEGTCKGVYNTVSGHNSISKQISFYGYV